MCEHAASPGTGVARWLGTRAHRPLSTPNCPQQGPCQPSGPEQGELTFNQTTEIMNKTNRTEQKTESQNKKRRSDSLSKPALGARPGLRPHLQGSQALLSPPRTRRLPDRQAPSHPPASASRRHLLETPCPPAACFSAGLPTPGSVC